ncbi:MAG: uL30 family ribosomal protein [archaeon]
MTEEIKEQKKEEKSKPKSKDKIAVILIRGLVGITVDIKDTLFLLRLRKKHTCVILEDNAVNQGMLKKVKDYVAYGEVSEATIKELISKRGKKNPKDPTRTKPFFELAPPRGGFERKGIKKPFKLGGALGYRKNKINDLIKKML